MPAVSEEPELPTRRRRREATTVQHEKPSGPRDVDTRPPEVGGESERGAAARLHETPGGERSDAGHAHEQLARRARDLEREDLGMRERPRRLRVVVEGEVAVAVERELLEAEAVVAQEMLRLVETELAARRRGRKPFHRRAGDRLKRAEVCVVQELLTLETRYDAED